MRATFKLWRWVAAASVATAWLGSSAYGQTHYGGFYQQPPARPAAFPSSSEYLAASQWASFGKPPMPGSGAEYAQPAVAGAGAYYGGPAYQNPLHPGGMAGPGDASCGVYGSSLLGENAATYGECHGLCGWQCEPRSGWFAGVGGLIMTRDRDNFFAFSYDTNDESIQLVSNRDVEIDTAGGVEARFGRYFHCGQSSLEFVFWSVIPGTQSYQLLGADVIGDLNGIHNWDDLTYNGNQADAYVNDAVVHRIRKEYEFQNYEVNWNHHLGAVRGGAWELQTITGFRIFRFREKLDFAADTVDARFTGAADEIHYLSDVDNRLYGFQLGGRSEYHLSERFSLTAKVLGGIYANDVDHHSRVGGSAGVAVVNNGPNNGREFDISSSKTDIALMGELELGLLYRVGRNWEIGGGYRAMGISGVALATNQIYPDLRGVNDVELVDINGDLILHGGFVHLLYNY